MQFENRYQRQIAFGPIGIDGQLRLSKARATVIGIGALGTAIVNSLARAGFGFIRVVDGDRVEESNLQRQMLFDETDAAEGRHKATAAAAHVALINSSVIVEPLVMRVDESNVDAVIGDVDVVLDGSDNFEVRYIVNDACRRLGVPWVYGGVLADSGVTMNVLPGSGPCLRCVMPAPPEPGSFATPETAGVLNQVTAVIGAIEAVEAVKIAVGSPAIRRTLLSVSLWDASFHSAGIERDPGCPACAAEAKRPATSGGMTPATGR